MSKSMGYFLAQWATWTIVMAFNDAVTYSIATIIGFGIMSAISVISHDLLRKFFGWVNSAESKK